MNTQHFQYATYYVSGRLGYSLDEALRHWKAKFETVKHFQRDVITHPSLYDLGDFVKELWDDIDPITVAEALQEKNAELRRVMFDCIGVAKLFAALEPELLDRQVLAKSRTRWNDKNKPWQHDFEDVYELYRIEGSKLFGTETGERHPASVFAVRCWCTSTEREYWLYVPHDVATGTARWSGKSETYDAIKAIAWTIRIDITNPKKVFRQGDIIVVEESETSEQVVPYHLCKQQYINLLFSET